MLIRACVLIGNITVRVIPIVFFQMPVSKTEEELEEDRKQKLEKEKRKKGSFFSRLSNVFFKNNLITELKELLTQAFKKKDEDPVSIIFIVMKFFLSCQDFNHFKIHSSIWCARKT